MKEKIAQIEEQYNVKVILCTKVGSHLYGTDGENSDVDYKGIFIPTKDSLLLDEALTFIDLSTNKSGQKNTAEDVDFTLCSVQTWAKQVFNGETGALDLLFSIFSKPIFVDDDFRSFVTDNYKSMLSNKPKAFVGYANQQAKKYSLKKDRYQELKQVMELLKAATPDGGNLYKLESKWETIKTAVKALPLKYTSFVMAPGPRKAVECEYIEVLGRKYHPSLTFASLETKLQKVEKDYGARTKGCESPTEWKSLSHAVRIIDEIAELLETQYITFPLPNAEYIKEVKAGKVNQQEVSDYLQEKLDVIDILMESTPLQKEPNKELFTKWLKGVYNE